MLGPEAAAHALVTASSRDFDDAVVNLLYYSRCNQMLPALCCLLPAQMMLKKVVYL